MSQPARLEAALKERIGREIEVFLPNQYYEGILMRVENGLINCYSDTGGYDSSGITFIIPLNSIQYVRILPK
ncbi:hypothetical protein [Gorillibacterium timonense]|uniref:hypothetical protein n=1 Tax=Gorillibacterium timonense TaxID=1689269 RepID=UPI00071CCC65|nr:hypothetical protein [Gorillibacterium timonense]